MLLEWVNSHKKDNYYLKSARLSRKFKLPNLDQNSIFTSRSVVKINDPAQSSNKSVSMKKKQQQNQYLNQEEHSHRKNSHMPQTKKFISLTPRRQRQFYTQEKAKQRLRIRRNQQLQYSLSKHHLAIGQTKNQKHIIDTILKLTKQLGMNNPDYLNYMQGFRLEHKEKEKQMKERSRKVINSLKKLKTENSNNLNFSQPLHLMTLGTKYHEEIKQQQACVSEEKHQQQLHNIQSTKALKTTRKVKHKKTTKFHTIEGLDSQVRDRCEQLSKSIRGWTKHGKMYEENDN